MMKGRRSQASQEIIVCAAASPLFVQQGCLRGIVKKFHAINFSIRAEFIYLYKALQDELSVKKFEWIGIFSEPI